MYIVTMETAKSKASGLGTKKFTAITVLRGKSPVCTSHRQVTQAK